MNRLRFKIYGNRVIVNAYFNGMLVMVNPSPKLTISSLAQGKRRWHMAGVWPLRFGCLQAIKLSALSQKIAMRQVTGAVLAQWHNAGILLFFALVLVTRHVVIDCTR